MPPVPSPRALRAALPLALLLSVRALPLAAAGPSGAVKLAPLAPYKTAVPPVLDGVLDDEVWSKAPSESGFKTWNPDYGRDMSERTVVSYAYDEENLYFAYRCYDRRPDLVKAAMAARDTVQLDDWICMNLDTFADQQSLYALYVNPLGVQGDSRFEGGQEDFSVDVVWYSAGRIDAEGYAVEVRIPFKSLRYARREPVRMGIIFERRISRLSEGGTFPPLDPARGPNFLTQTRELDFTGIRHYTLLEVLPAATYSRSHRWDGGALRAGPGLADASLTGKLGLTSQLVLDATVNPDFSQVESDAGQVDFNQRYALFYPEKRPFFLEGQEKFTLAACRLGDPLQAAVNTRTIVDPRLGFKLIGKLAPRDTFASIYAGDARPEGEAAGTASVSIARWKHALAGDSYLGGLWTGRFDGTRANAVAGVDGQLRLSGSHVLGFHALGSRTRPDGGAPSRDGHAAGLEYSISNRNWIVDVSAQDLGRDFETDSGYLTRNGLTRIKAGALPMIYPRSRVLLRVEPMVHLVGLRDKASGLWESVGQLDLRLRFPRNTTVSLGGRTASEVYLGRRFDRSHLKLVFVSQVTRRVSVSFTGTSGAKIRYVDAPYQGRGTDAAAALTVLPAENLDLTVSLAYSDFTRSADGVKEFDYAIARSLNTLQLNRYLFLRAILEWNSFRERLVTDFLASFTYIPGTVVHLGYGSAFERRPDERPEPSDRLRETSRGFFFKASYLWRL